MKKISIIVSGNSRNIQNAKKLLITNKADEKVIFTSIKDKKELSLLETKNKNYLIINDLNKLKNKIIENNTKIIFCDGSFSDISVKLIKFILNFNPDITLFRLENLPVPSNKSNWFNYIFYKVGSKKNSLYIYIINLFKLIIYSFFNYPYSLVRYSNSKSTYLIPDYSKIKNLQYKRINCSISREYSNFKDVDLIYIDSQEKPNNFALKKIKYYLITIQKIFDQKYVFVKFHPNSSKEENENFLSILNNDNYKNLNFLDYKFSKKKERVLIGISSSGLFTLKNNLSISLAALLNKENMNWFSEFNGVDPREYVQGLNIFFNKPFNFLMPSSEKQLKDKLKDKLK